jgi:hypothetical protein
MEYGVIANVILVGRFEKIDISTIGPREIGLYPFDLVVRVNDGLLISCRWKNDFQRVILVGWMDRVINGVCIAGSNLGDGALVAESLMGNANGMNIKTNNPYTASTTVVLLLVVGFTVNLR